MSETLEIEFKNLLTKAEYNRLLKEFNITSEEIFTQENYYFDTPDFRLKELTSALRIRRKKDQYELTLKQPAEVGLLETTQLLSEDEYQSAIHSSLLPIGVVLDRIIEMGISPNDIEYFGLLKTNRVEFSYINGLLVFDHSFYLTKEDYEVEYESEDYQQGLSVFLQFLDQYAIPKRKTENKIQRFYQQKLLQNH
nr:CYTH domain-containing protein [Neobacillus sp. Marseille-Q6967]